MVTHETHRPGLRPFFTLWTGQALSLVGSQAVQFALVWWLTEQTGSAAVLALAALFGLLPPVVMGPVIGALIDRWNRKVVMFVADAGSAVAAMVLAYLFVADQATVSAVFALLLIRGVGGAFHGPAMLASTSLMVEEEHLTRIQGLNQALQGALVIAAPPLGAALLGWMPMQGVMLVDVGSALLALIPLWFVHVPQPTASSGDDGESSVWTQMIDGMRYLTDRRGHLMLVVMSAAINLCLVPAFALLPLLVAGELDGSAMQLGGMSAFMGIGMLIGGVLLGAVGGTERRIVTTLSALIALGLAVGALGTVPAGNVFLANAAMLLVGLIAPWVNGPIAAIMQATVAKGFQGRVFTLMGSLAGAAAPVGLLLAAPIAELLGVRAWFLAAGMITTVMGFVGFVLPTVMKIEEPIPAEVMDQG